MRKAQKKGITKAMFDSLPNEMSTKVIQNFLGYSEQHSCRIIKNFVANGYIELYKKMSGTGKSRVPVTYKKTGKEYVTPLTKAEKRLCKAIKYMPNKFTLKMVSEVLDFSKSHASRIIKLWLRNQLIIKIADPSREKWLWTPAIYQKTTTKETPMALPTIKKSDVLVTSLTDHPTLIDCIKAEFLTLTNEEKAELITDFIPSLDPKELLGLLNEAYPKPLKFADVKAKDLLFHPLLGNVVVERVTEDRLCFSANGVKWLTDKDGYVDGKREKKPVLFFNIDDYVNEMKKGD